MAASVYPFISLLLSSSFAPLTIACLYVIVAKAFLLLALKILYVAKDAIIT